MAHCEWPGLAPIECLREEIGTEDEGLWFVEGKSGGSSISASSVMGEEGRNDSSDRE